MLSPVRCTLTAEQLLSRGILPTPLRTSSKGNGLDLASCCGRLLKVQVDKEQQISDWNRAVLSSEQLSYVALDAWLPLELWKEQLPRLRKMKMRKVHQVESEVLPAVAKARLTGIQLDLRKIRTLLSESKKQLYHLSSKLEQDLGVDNINSPKQMANAIEARGHKLPITEAGNKSVSDQSLRSLYVKDSELTPLRQYRSVKRLFRLI